LRRAGVLRRDALAAQPRCSMGSTGRWAGPV
jgi:hypothetical protein